MVGRCAHWVTVATAATSAAAGVRAAAAPGQTWSNLTLATCDPNDPQQRFQVSDVGGEGAIIDAYTGRCVTVWGCADVENSNLVISTCGSSVCPGDSSGGNVDKAQAWNMAASGKQIKSPLSSLQRCIDASVSHSEGESPLVTHSCGGDTATNQMWTVTKEGMLQVGAGDYSPPCAAMPCCLKVDCGEVVPDSLGSCHPGSSWGKFGSRRRIHMYTCIHIYIYMYI